MKIILLTDYKDFFGSKQKSAIYRGGMAKKLLNKYFAVYGYDIEYIHFADIDFSKRSFKDEFILYTSSEDVGYHYKSFIEDIVYSLELHGANIIPKFKFLRANNNKVFMELLRKEYGREWNDNLNSWIFGTIEEMIPKIDKFNFPIVIKDSQGAMSEGVLLAKNKEELIDKAKKMFRTGYLIEDIKDKLRTFKYKDYVKESLYRRKFILQQFIPNLNNDWKVLVFGKRYYIFYRPTRENDFRASGSGHNIYLYGNKAPIPNGIFNFAELIFRTLDVPHLSLDIAYDGKKFFLIEFQAVYFGTVGQEASDCYYVSKNGQWIEKYEKLELEKVYVESIVNYLENFKKDKKS